jgi:CheY-like chemotaxis protein
MKALRILVLEDDALIGALLGEMLVGMGYDVCAIEATEGEAVVAAAEQRPDLIIADATLGEGCGIRAVETILAARPAPYLFTSGDTLSVLARMPHAVVVQKPYDEARLAQGITRALNAAKPLVAA